MNQAQAHQAMRARMQPQGQFVSDELGAVLLTERSVRGWRGLTDEGEILDVTVERNGHALKLPESLQITGRDGTVTGYLALPKEIGETGLIDDYQRKFDAALALLRKNRPDDALTMIDDAVRIAPTARARFNRALILLACNKWDEGLTEYEAVEQHRIFMRKEYRQCVEAGLQRWRGENLFNKRILLIHDHGFGDSIMCLRYVPRLQAMGADVALMVPKELQRLAAQVAPVTDEPVKANYFCSLLFVLQALKQTPDVVPRAPYLKVYAELRDKWRNRIDDGHKNIGVAWSIGKVHDGDYPREIPLGLLTKHLGREGVLISVQQQGDAEADMLGIDHYKFDDFADCAACMSFCDEIVTVDTAAVHLAGAIGHPRISLLLSHWSSWRWQANWYENLTIYRQHAPGDWASALNARSCHVDRIQS